MKLAGLGVYTFSEASKLAGTDPRMLMRHYHHKAAYLARKLEIGLSEAP